MYKIPLQNYPNQTFKCSIPVDGVNKYLKFFLSYNAIGEYWMMSIADGNTGKEIISNINILSTYGSINANILHPYKYLNIGSAYIVPAAETDDSMPDDTSLGSDYILVWGDTK